MKMYRNILCIIILFLLFNCKNESKNIEENTNENIVNYLNKKEELIKENLFENQLKGISSLYLSKEQEVFYNKRLNYFIAILNNDKNNKLEYYKYAKEYYSKFPKTSVYYYFWSKDLFDNRLFSILEKEFGEINISLKYLNEYYMEIDMFKEINEN
jgi:hypothetical protein